MWILDSSQVSQRRGYMAGIVCNHPVLSSGRDFPLRIILGLARGLLCASLGSGRLVAALSLHRITVNRGGSIIVGESRALMMIVRCVKIAESWGLGSRPVAP